MSKRIDPKKSETWPRAARRWPAEVARERLSLVWTYLAGVLSKDKTAGHCEIPACTPEERRVARHAQMITDPRVPLNADPDAYAAWLETLP